jgi:hypothetical protein
MENGMGAPHSGEGVAILSIKKLLLDRIRHSARDDSQGAKGERMRDRRSHCGGSLSERAARRHRRVFDLSASRMPSAIRAKRTALGEQHRLSVCVE